MTRRVRPSSIQLIRITCLSARIIAELLQVANRLENGFSLWLSFLLEEKNVI